MFCKGVFCSFGCRNAGCVGAEVRVEGGECGIFSDVHAVVLFVFVMLYGVNIVLIVVYEWMGV